MQQKLILHHYWRSSCSWRVRWALNLKGLPYEAKAVNLLNSDQKKPDYTALNPAANVPTLVVDGRPLTESGAILEWLEEAHPTPALLPQDPFERFEARRLAHTILAGTQPIQNLSVMQHLTDDPEKRQAWARHFIEKGLRTYETLLQCGRPGTYSIGSQISHADLCLIPQVYNANRFGVDMTQFPLIQGINERALATKACDAAAPHSFEPK